MTGLKLAPGFMVLLVVTLRFAGPAGAQRLREEPKPAPRFTPLSELERSIEGLRSREVDVTRLQAELNGLRPAWEAIDRKQQELAREIGRFYDSMGRLQERIDRSDPVRQAVMEAGPVHEAEEYLVHAKLDAAEMLKVNKEIASLKELWRKIQARIKAAPPSVPVSDETTVSAPGKEELQAIQEAQELQDRVQKLRRFLEEKIPKTPPPVPEK